MRTGNIEIAGSKLGIHSLEAGDISALGVVAVGTTVYNTSYGVIQWYNGTSWVTPTHTVTGSGGIYVANPAPGFYVVVNPHPEHLPSFCATRPSLGSGASTTLCEYAAPGPFSVLPSPYFNTTSGIFTVPFDGIYTFSYHIKVANSSTNTIYTRIEQWRSGSINHGCPYDNQQGSISTYNYFNQTQTFACISGDTVFVNMFGCTDAELDKSQIYFQGHFVGNT